MTTPPAHDYIQHSTRPHLDACVWPLKGPVGNVCGLPRDQHEEPADPAPGVDIVEAEAYLAGVEAGRRQAAADIRAAAAKYTGDQYRHFEMCARIAERRK